MSFDKTFRRSFINGGFVRRESRVRKRMVSCQRGWGRIWGRRIPAEHKLLWGVLKHGGRQHPSSTHGTAIKQTADSTYSYTDCNFGVSASCSRTLGHAASDWNQPPLPITELQTPGKKKQQNMDVRRVLLTAWTDTEGILQRLWKFTATPRTF